jgi:hypothetical protein
VRKLFPIMCAKRKTGASVGLPCNHNLATRRKNRFRRLSRPGAVRPRRAYGKAHRPVRRRGYETGRVSEIIVGKHLLTEGKSHGRVRPVGVCKQSLRAVAGGDRQLAQRAFGTIRFWVGVSSEKRCLRRPRSEVNSSSVVESASTVAAWRPSE